MQHQDAENLRRVFDGAKLVNVHPELRQVAVWSGGITINIYDANTLNEITCFSLSDEKGRPEDRSTVNQHIEDIFKNTMEDGRV